MTNLKTITNSEVAKHNKPDDLWCIINGKVYDLTNFVSQHPGGPQSILDYKGKDASAQFNKFHPSDIIQKLLPPSALLGIAEQKDGPGANPTDKLVSEFKKTRSLLPNIYSIVNINEFKLLAKKVLDNQAWAYYSTGSNDELTLLENTHIYKRIYLRPRVMVDVSDVSVECNILGFKSSMPIYITATALGKLGHPLGEINLVKASYSKGIIYMLPTLSSCTLEEMFTSRQKEQILFMQLYVNPNKRLTISIIEKAIQRNCKGLFVTVDAPCMGKREADMRTKSNNTSYIQHNTHQTENKGTSRAISKFIDASLNWSDLEWIKKAVDNKMKVILKGIQTHEDAIKAVEYEVDGIVISNHGGRQADTARSSIEILVEVQQALCVHYKNNPNSKKIDVFVDGGITRGSDIFKAYALGAKAVGVGKSLLYAMSTYGQEGVEYALDLLKEELEMTMRLTGARALKDITPKMVDIKNIYNRVNSSPNSAYILSLVNNKL